MAYGRQNYNNGYGNQGGYNNNRNYGNNNGGYQKQQQQERPPFNPVEEINARIDMYMLIQETIKQKGLDPADFAFAIGGWTTSLILEQKKG